MKISTTQKSHSLQSDAHQNLSHLKNFSRNLTPMKISLIIDSHLRQSHTHQNLPHVKISHDYFYAQVGCYAATQVALQLFQERTQVVCSNLNMEAQKRPARGHSQAEMDLGLAVSHFVWNFCATHRDSNDIRYSHGQRRVRAPWYREPPHFERSSFVTENRSVIYIGESQVQSN